jgi:hypothetical protein
MLWYFSVNFSVVVVFNSLLENLSLLALVLVLLVFEDLLFSEDVFGLSAFFKKGGDLKHRFLHFCIHKFLLFLIFFVVSLARNGWPSLLLVKILQGLKLVFCRLPILRFFFLYFRSILVYPIAFFPLLSIFKF